MPRFESSGSGWRIEDKEDDLLSSPPVDISAATTKKNVKLDGKRFNHNVLIQLSLFGKIEAQGVVTL